MIITIKLTPLQAKGLLACAEDGAEGILSDTSAAESYIGGAQAQKAAEQALQILRRAYYAKVRN